MEETLKAASTAARDRLSILLSSRRREKIFESNSEYLFNTEAEKQTFAVITATHAVTPQRHSKMASRQTGGFGEGGRPPPREVGIVAV
eukprot:5285350-Prymnesium_polylepis.1